MDTETGEVQVDRVAAIHDVGRVINPLGASSQVEGGIIQGIGHTLSEERLLDPQTGTILTQSLDAYRLPTIADVPPEIVAELLDYPGEHLTNLGSKGLGKPPIVPIAAAIANAIRDATGADVRSLPICREEMLRALREARWSTYRGENCSSSVLRPPEAADGCARQRIGRSSQAGTELVPLHPGRSRKRGNPGRRSATSYRRGSTGHRIGAGTTLAELGVELSGHSPRRCERPVPARRLAPAQLDGHDWWQPAPGDALLVLAAQLSRATCTAAIAATHVRASTVSTRSSATSGCASAHPYGAWLQRCSHSAPPCAPTRRELTVADLYRLPTDDNREVTTIEPDELILELEVPAAGGKHVSQGDGPTGGSRSRSSGSL